jgi:hypothetical protein
MQDHLDGKPKAELLWAADILTSRSDIQKVSRSERRNRDALICWFCESFPDLLNNSKILSDVLDRYRDPFPESSAEAQPSEVLDTVEQWLSSPDEEWL